MLRAQGLSSHEAQRISASRQQPNPLLAQSSHSSANLLKGYNPDGYICPVVKNRTKKSNLFGFIFWFNLVIGMDFSVSNCMPETEPIIMDDYNPFDNMNDRPL